MELRTWSLLLLLVQGQQRDVGNLDNLETDSGDVTDGVTLTTESSYQNLVVLFNVVETTVTGHEGCDLLTVLDKLNTDALSDGRVRLLSLDTTGSTQKPERSHRLSLGTSTCRPVIELLSSFKQLPSVQSDNCIRPGAEMLISTQKPDVI